MRCAAAAVVVVWRDEPLTFSSIESLAALEPGPDLIVCVAQECSPGFVATLRSRHPAVELVEVGDNLGFAGGVNTGMAVAVGREMDWVLLLNNDATVDARCLQVLLDEVVHEPDVAVAGPAIRVADRPDELWFGGGVHSARFAFTRHTGLRRPASHPPPTSDTDKGWGCCVLVSVAAWRALGPFRDDYFLYYEDVEWCRRARDAGWRCRYVGQVLCTHALGVSSGQRGSLGLSDNTAYYLARNPLRFALDTPEPVRRLTRVLGILVVWGSYNVLRIARTRRWSVARAYLQGTSDAAHRRMGPRPTRS